MKIIKLTAKNSQAVIKQAVAMLAAGKILVYPTETFYGLGCAASDGKAIRKIYRIKGREKNKALPFLLADMKMAGKYLKFKPDARKLAKKHWPGPLSLVLPATAAGKKLFGIKEAGVRVSSNKFATSLVKALGQPLVSTSANLSGRPAAATAVQAIGYFNCRRYKPDLVIDAGRLKKSKGSTFVSLIGKQPKVLREGDINLKIQGHKIQ